MDLLKPLLLWGKEQVMVFQPQKVVGWLNTKAWHIWDWRMRLGAAFVSQNLVGGLSCECGCSAWYPCPPPVSQVTLLSCLLLFLLLLLLFLLLAAVGFELRALHLLGRHSST
jgi:hypothetical protein